ncbi:MAG: SDR family oxidoreductase [Anaerolineae bacterium]|nr:SDR family oxidoreductase [Anaerolineae bacterium]MCA9910029.1 SDR family oxidoreductase [Anaerolineae bacterium]
MNSNASKVALVTGAGRGIGKAISIGLAQDGFDVVCAARTQDQIEAVAQTIEAAGGQALAVPTDVADYRQTVRMVQAAITRFKRLDVIVVNAGAILERQLITESEPFAFAQTIQVNLIGAYHTIRAAVEHMKARGGQIIVVGSGLGHKVSTGRAAYAASKGGLWMLIQVLAAELRDYGICVNELVPGPVLTDMSPPELSGRDSTGWRMPEFEWLKRPEDVVPLALMLARNPTHGPTGQSFSLMRR